MGCIVDTVVLLTSPNVYMRSVWIESVVGF